LHDGDEVTDYQFPRAPQIERAYRAAHRALEGIVSPGYSFAPEEDLPITDVISQFGSMVREAELAVAAQLGPLISWEAPRRDTDWELVMSGIDLDNDAYDFGAVKLGGDAFDGPDGWQSSVLGRAARAYKRASQWDFAPDEAGLWLVMLAPVSGIGGEDGPWHYTGHLAGFVILYDRDRDGAYESVGHMWTAAAWRRRGIARRLLAEARSRFQFKGIEGPYTADGAAFVEACAQDPS
jgi:ribosomal protein S18 acetylase RimI-like enzyme